MKVTKIADIDRRLPEHGRIRIGEKSDKGQPQKIDVFRFTSHDKEAIEQIAALYGGTAKPWADRGQFEVRTVAKAIPIVLPPDPLGGTPLYELWSGGGCLRRCDGETCLVPKMTQQGAEMMETPCMCDANQKLECKPKTRLTVILPEIRFGGGWRLESGGWNVAHEMPGMVGMIESLQLKGMSRAELALEERVSKFAGKTRKFVVPVLRPAVSVNLMLEGQGAVLALGKAEVSVPDEIQPEVLTGDFVTREGEHNAEYQMAQDLKTATNVVPLDDWDIVDAEIVEEIVSEELQRKRNKMHALLNEIGMGTTERHALVMRITNGRNSSSNDLDESGLNVLISALEAIKKAEAFYDGVDENGWAVVSRG